MNSISNVSANPNLKLLSSFGHRLPILSRPVSSLSFRNSPLSLPSSTVKASSSSRQPSSSPEAPKPNIFTALNPRNPRPESRKTLTQSSLGFPFSLLKSTVITTLTAAAILFGRFWFKLAPAIASSGSTTAAVQGAVLDDEKERDLEENLLSNPNDVEALRNLMEIKIQNLKIDEAIGIIDKLIELNPWDVEWLLLQSHLYVHNGEVENAKTKFNEILERDPLKVEAYHGLVMAATKSGSVADLQEVEKKIVEGMNLCKQEKKMADMRDFKLLVAQIRVIEGMHDEALKVYQELVEEEPRDFRPYLCRGIIYTLLNQKKEAEKNFEKYRRLVPKDHPYASYFDDNMIASKFFAQKAENEMAISKK